MGGVVAEDICWVAGRLVGLPIRDLQRKRLVTKAPVICRVVKMCICK
jgi:hypothetical protein